MNVQPLFADAGIGSRMPRDPVDQCIPTFDEFWKVWPKREAKKDALRAWNKVRDADKIAALNALPNHVARWQREGRARNHIPHPATWLNGERWDDELDEIFAPAPAQRSAQSGPPWWTSHTLMERKAAEVGVGLARPGETNDQYRARIHAAIDDQQRYRQATG